MPAIRQSRCGADVAGYAPARRGRVTEPGSAASAAPSGGPSLSSEIAADWDGALASWPRSHLLQTRGWGQVQATAGWEALPTRVLVPEAPWLPLLVLRSRAPGPLPTRLYVPRGPACAPDDARAWTATLVALRALAARTGAASITIEPQADTSEAAALDRVLGDGWRATRSLQPIHTAVVDLTGGEEAVLARMHSKTRYNARLAARRGVVAAPIADPGEAAEVLAWLCAATAARQAIAQPGSAHLRAVLEHVPGSRVVVASVEGEPVAGALVAGFGTEAVYLYGGSTDRHRDRQPPTLLHLEVMRLLIAEGRSRYDLWGVPPDADPSQPWHGLRRFKLGLGAQERTLAGAQRLRLRPLPDTIERTLVATRTRLGRVRRLSHHPARR